MRQLKLDILKYEQIHGRDLARRRQFNRTLRQWRLGGGGGDPTSTKFLEEVITPYKAFFTDMKHYAEASGKDSTSKQEFNELVKAKTEDQCNKICHKKHGTKNPFKTPPAKKVCRDTCNTLIKRKELFNQSKAHFQRQYLDHIHTAPGVTLAPGVNEVLVQIDHTPEVNEVLVLIQDIEQLFGIDT